MAIKQKTKTANHWLRVGHIVGDDAEACGFSPAPLYEVGQTVEVAVATDPHGNPYSILNDSIAEVLMKDYLFCADDGANLYFSIEASKREEFRQLANRFGLRWKRYKGLQVAISYVS